MIASIPSLKVFSETFNTTSHTLYTSRILCSVSTACGDLGGKAGMSLVLNIGARKIFIDMIVCQVD